MVVSTGGTSLGRLIAAFLFAGSLLPGCAQLPGDSGAPASSGSRDPGSVPSASVPRPSVTPHLPPTPTVSPVADPDAGRTWAEACQPGDLLGGSWVRDVTTTARGLAAVGRLSSMAPNEAERIIWTTTDGAAWSRHDLPATTVEFAGAIAWHDGRLVVAGAAGEDELALAWASLDATHWVRSELLVDGGVQDAAAGESGFVLVGESNRHSGPRPAIWQSPTGLGWQRVGSATMTDRYGAFDGVVAGPSGYVAFGLVGASPFPEVSTSPLPEAARYAGAPWTSTDGVTWQPVADPTPFAWAQVRAIAVGPTRLTAVGWRADRSTGEPSAAAWTSLDGSAWTSIDPVGNSPRHLDVAAADRSGRVAAFSATDGGDGGGTWWLSSDDAHWEAVTHPLFSDVTLSAMTGYGDGFVAVGMGPGVALDPDRCPIWVSPAP